MKKFPAHGWYKISVPQKAGIYLFESAVNLVRGLLCYQLCTLFGATQPTTDNISGEHQPLAGGNTSTHT